MKHNFESIYYNICNSTSIYEGVPYETLKNKIVDNAIKSGYQCLNEWELEDIFDEILMDLCKWGVLSWNHGYLFHAQSIPPGTDLQNFLKNEERVYLFVYKNKEERDCKKEKMCRCVNN